MVAEILHLLFNILKSIILSVTLTIPLLFRRSPPSHKSPALYQGTVWHSRRRPVHHSFTYPVRYAYFDLSTSSLPDHLSLDSCRGIAQTSGPVHLLTIPRSMGYEQNPLSLYYCYDIEDSSKKLKKCIAEVTNTPWGERVMFVFDPHSDFVAKPLHVSPFMDMKGNWRIKASSPEETLNVAITVDHPELGEYFSAILKAERVCSSSVELFFWLMPHKVALWIYWHAIVLMWKGVVFIQHPRYSNSCYREEAQARDEVQCCKFAKSANCGSIVNNKRWMEWRNAKWPWC